MVKVPSGRETERSQAGYRKQTSVMSASPPFIDPDTGTLDTDQIRTEAFPLAGLIGLFAGLALVPFLIVFLIGGNSVLGLVLLVVTQLIIAVGAGIVLMYVIARGIQLADE